MATLGYWNLRGLAEPIRLLLHFTGTKFEDKLYNSRDQWLEDKEKLGMDLPNLPYYLSGSVKLSESDAILRHIGRGHGLAGTTEEDFMRVDVALGVLTDIMRAFSTLCYNEDFEKLKVDFIANVGVPMKKLSAMLGDQDYVAGKQITFADFKLFVVLERYLALIPDCLKDFANLRSFHQRILDLPAIKTYRASPQFQDMKNRLNGPMAKFGGGP